MKQNHLPRSTQNTRHNTRCSRRPISRIGDAWAVGGRRGINPTPMGVNVRYGCHTGCGGVLWCVP